MYRTIKLHEYIERNVERVRQSGLEFYRDLLCQIQSQEVPFENRKNAFDKKTLQYSHAD